jgi:hypothetical protein
MTLFYFKLSQAHAALENELIKNYSLMQENFLEKNKSFSRGRI